VKFKPGDRVRFLNDATEGTVTRILSKERVEVTDTDGFTHVSEEKHLVYIEFIPLENDLHVDDTSVTVEKKQQPFSQTKQKNEPLLTHFDDDYTIYAFVRLLNPSEPFTTDVEISIGNNTEYVVPFSVAKRLDDLRIGLHSGILGPKKDQSIGVFTQDELYHFSGFEIQLLFSGEREFRPRPPAVKILQFNSSDFLNPEFKNPRPEFNDMLLMPLYSFNIERDVDLKGLLEKYKEYNKEDEMRKPAKGAKKSAFTVLTRQKVVDLHIEELVKDHASMSNAQIISYQLNYFIYEMEQAIIQKLHKITFIHGVGQGILKNAIREELKKYNGILFSEAPPEKFGYGATEVEFL
jgi:hypothetical protein